MLDLSRIYEKSDFVKIAKSLKSLHSLNSLESSSRDDVVILVKYSLEDLYLGYGDDGFFSGVYLRNVRRSPSDDSDTFSFPLKVDVNSTLDIEPSSFPSTITKYSIVSINVKRNGKDGEVEKFDLPLIYALNAKEVFDKSLKLLTKFQDLESNKP